jgi:PilZ domain
MLRNPHFQGQEGLEGMEKQNSVRKFEYRPCRIATGFELEFVAEGKALRGVCEDLSEDGIRVTLDGSVAVGTIGVLSFSHSCGVLELESQVTHANMSHFGLVFMFQTPWERGMVKSLIASIQNSPADPRVLPYS